MEFDSSSEDELTPMLGSARKRKAPSELGLTEEEPYFGLFVGSDRGNMFGRILANEYNRNFRLNSDQSIRSSLVYGAKSSRLCFLREVGGNPGLVARMKASSILKRHTGCVNTVNWSEKGDLLVSGSDDTRVCIWDYQRRKLLGAIASSHTANIFCTKFMPATNSEQVVSCAGDFAIKLYNVNYSAGARNDTQFGREIHTFGCHGGRVKKLVTEPLNPNLIISASEDGTLRQFDLREKHVCASDDCDTVLVDLRFPRRVIDFYSISLNQMNPNYLAASGCDPIVRVYDRRMLAPGRNVGTSQPCVRRFCPTHLADSPNMTLHSPVNHITGVSFDRSGTEIVASYSGDHIYVFDMNETKDTDRSDEGASKKKHKERSHAKEEKEKERSGHSPKSEELMEGENSRSTEEKVEEESKNKEEVTKEEKESAEEMWKLGNKEFGMGRFRKAIYFYSMAIGKDPENITYYNNRAAAAHQLGKRKYNLRALKDCDKVLSMEPKNAKALYRKSRIFSAMKKYSLASKYAEKAIETSEENEPGNSTVPGMQRFLEHLQSKLEAEKEMKGDLEGEEKEEDIEELESEDDSDFEDEDSYDDDSAEDGSDFDEEDESDDEVQASSRVNYNPERDSSFKQVFTGHCNVRTVKEVSFFGPRSEYVISGSDDGNIFIWDKKTAKIVQVLNGDQHVVNCIQGHPFDPVIASSGIETNVKIWTPSGEPTSWQGKIDEIVQKNKSRLMSRPTQPVIPMALLRNLLRMSRDRNEEEGDEEEGEGQCVVM